MMDRRAMARLISDIENGRPKARLALDQLARAGGQARVIGITGPPGCGKSTLAGEIARYLRRQAQPPNVAIVAVDPTSPFSGGAILGDRIRMRDLYGDPGVFIRSMASRGALGGIASATADVVTVLDACGYGVILVETVGAGQLEIDVARVAHTVVVVEAPGLGDEVQAVKAGILEIADIVAVNKADRDGVEQAVSALRAALDLALSATDGSHLSHHLRDAAAGASPAAGPAWRVPIVKTSAAARQGVDELVERIQQHGAYLRESGEGARRRRQGVENDIRARLAQLLLERGLGRLPPDRLQNLVDAVVERKLHASEAAHRLMGLLDEPLPPAVA